MASDILLVLQSDHRQLSLLADRCGRPGRGLEDSEGDLQEALAAHATALLQEVLPGVRGTAELAERLVGVLEHLPAEGCEELVGTAGELIALEQRELLEPAAALSIEARRRLGRAFRIRRQAAMRARRQTRRPKVSQSELYQVARRAGIPQRSRMTQAELLSAVDRLRELPGR